MANTEGRPQAIIGHDGTPLKSECSIVQDGRDWLIGLESRSGGSGTTPPRNPEYDKGLSVLLGRIASGRGVIHDATVEPSRGPIRLLPVEQKRLRGEGLSFPLKPSLAGVEALRVAIMRAQKSVALKPRDTSSNPWRRIQLRVRFDDSFPFEHVVRSWLLGSLERSPSPGEIEGVGTLLDAEKAFSPETELDGRRRVLASIARRQGQPAFRKSLLVAYRGACAISGCTAEPALEAAHILPYRGGNTNDVRNGILLRADLHTLFDCGLLAVDADSFRVIVAPELGGSEYERFAGQRISLPGHQSDLPSRDALHLHHARSSCPASALWHT